MAPKKFDTLYKKLDMEIDIEVAKVKILADGIYEVFGEQINNPVTGAEHRVRIVIPNGFEYRIAEMGGGSTTTIGGDIKLENNKDTYGQFAELHLVNTGILEAA